MTITEIKTIKFVADDGRAFESREDAEQYETCRELFKFIADNNAYPDLDDLLLRRWIFDHAEDLYVLIGEMTFPVSTEVLAALTGLA